jgi:cytochrome P450 family 4
LIDNFGESDSEFCTAKLKELKYFDQCVKEVLRLYSPVPAIQRRIFNEIQMAEQTIPKMTSVTVPIILIHRNPKVFEDPNKFDPDRFAEGKEYPPLSFIPFSAGPRNCVGQKFALMEVNLGFE